MASGTPRNAPTADPPATPTRRRIVAEILIVLGLSLGMSALYSIVSLVRKLYIAAQEQTSLGQQSTTLNGNLSDVEGFNLTYQLLAIATDLVPVALVCYLLWSSSRPHLSRLGIDGRHPLRDVLLGFGLTIPIGIAGLGIYLAGRALDLTVAVQPSGLAPFWWTIPVLLLSALRAGVQEEVIMLGYLFARLTDLGWSRWSIILSSAALRGTYHLYQGWGSFVANFAMGVVFGWLYTRGTERRVLPFVAAHFAIDAVVFVGAPAAASAWPELFGVS